MDQRIEALIKRLDGARLGETGAVHQARVASRRLRECLPVIGASGGDRLVGKASRRVRRITRALGPVREADVTLGLLDDLAGERPDLADAVGLVRARVVDERRARRRRLVAELRTREMARTLAVLERLRGHARPAGQEWRAVLAARLRGRSGALREAVAAAGVLYHPDAVHAVRIAAKKLRYALELADELRTAGTARPVSTLKSLQDRLGHLHDLDIVARIAVAVGAEHPLAPAEGLTSLVALLDARCREVHAQYLVGRDELDEVARDAAGRVVLAVLRGRQRRGSVTIETLARTG